VLVRVTIVLIRSLVIRLYFSDVPAASNLEDISALNVSIKPLLFKYSYACGGVISHVGALD